MNNILSYGKVLKELHEFKRSGTSTGEKFNLLDIPGHKYFKIMFYFYGDSDTRFNSGLLHPSWIDIDNIVSSKTDEMHDNAVRKLIEDFGGEHNDDEDYLAAKNEIYEKSLKSTDIFKNYEHYRAVDSAYNFLMNNNETYRAELLKQFINLLSNINCYSPWYFNKIIGIGDALDRKMFVDGKFEVPERGTLTINCLPDAFDNRIGMLLDMYRTIAYSWENKKEILPSNLRKFDMAVFVFESPVDGWNDTSNIGSKDDEGFMPSYKMFEFHDCEFNYNSSKSGYAEIDNQNGFSPMFNIEIFYNSCHEISYNEHTMQLIGDLMTADIQQMLYSDIYTENPSVQGEINSADFTYIQNISKDENFITSHKNELTKRYAGQKSKIIDQLLTMGKTAIKDTLKSAALGNLYSYSLTKINDQVNALKSGDYIGTAQALGQYAKNLGQSWSVMKDGIKSKANFLKDKMEYKSMVIRKNKFDKKSLFEEEQNKTPKNNKNLKNLRDAIQMEKDKMKSNSNLGVLNEDTAKTATKTAEIKKLYVESLTDSKSKTGLNNLHSDTIANN